MADTAGSYTIKASYSGSPLHTASDGSDTVIVTTRSTTTVLDCPATTSANSPLGCTVTVTDTASGTKSPPTGTVSFSFTSQPSGSTATVSACNITPLTSSHPSSAYAV